MLRLTGACLLSLLLLLAGCGSLPAREPVPVTHALSPDEVTTTTLSRIAVASTPAVEQGRSGFRLLPTGEYAFDARAALAEAAQRSIDAQYYHVHDDTAGVAFLHSLRDAARRGVRVRLLVDDYHAGDVFDLLIALHSEPGAEVRLFNPLLRRSGSPMVRLLWSWQDFDRAHRRMHNKLFVVDNTVAIFGGRNVADEYFWRHGQANFLFIELDTRIAYETQPAAIGHAPVDLDRTGLEANPAGLHQRCSLQRGEQRSAFSGSA